MYVRSDGNVLFINPTHLFSCFQDESSQRNFFYPEDESGVQPPPPPSTSSQLPSSQPVRLKNLSVDLSQDSFVRSGFSQSQSSQGRRGLSQASQAKKKKSRMGF